MTVRAFAGDAALAEAAIDEKRTKYDDLQRVPCRADAARGRCEDDVFADLEAAGLVADDGDELADALRRGRRDALRRALLRGSGGEAGDRWPLAGRPAAAGGLGASGGGGAPAAGVFNSVATIPSGVAGPKTQWRRRRPPVNLRTLAAVA